jgi:ABC-type multidrug transport system ATPase subunit
MSAGPRLLVSELSFSYPQRHVFNGWTAEFDPGLTWLRGSNGSGKSTLLKLLAGALPPLAGRCAAQGIDLHQQPLAYRRAVYWCGPGAIAFDHLRVREFFGFVRSLYPGLDLAALPRHLEGFGLAPFVSVRLSELSTGTQRKVALAAALSVGTPVVLLDEPLNALDAASLRYLRAQLATAAAACRQVWVVVSHEPLLEDGAPLRMLELPPPGA